MGYSSAQSCFRMGVRTLTIPVHLGSVTSADKYAPYRTADDGEGGDAQLDS